jgi:drug/metabolite transporter (DMT)-like permease
MAAFCFAMMGVFIQLAGDVPSMQKSFFRNIVAAICAGVVLLRQRPKFEMTGEKLGLLFARAICGTIGLLCNFYAVDHLVLADASMLNKMSPFFAIICSWFLLKERLNARQAIAVIVAFAGCLLVVKPTLSNMDLVPSLIGLLGGLGAGVAYTVVRMLGQRGVPGSVIVFFFSAFSTIVVTPYLIIIHAPMTGLQLFYLIMTGVTAAGGQFAITAAYTYAPARELSVYDYSQVIFSAIMGFVLFSQVPDRYSVLGYILIIGMAVYMFAHNRLEDRRAEKEAST